METQKQLETATKSFRRKVVNIYSPGAGFPELLDSLRNMAGFWGSASGNASLGQVVELAVTEWAKSPHLIKCSCCKAPLVARSMARKRGYKVLKCNKCGHINSLEEQGT